jgi:hypothetical protein
MAPSYVRGSGFSAWHHRGVADDDAACDEPAACRPRCPMCGSDEPPVWVHGHAQCAACKVNIDPCCGGAAFDVEAA